MTLWLVPVLVYIFFSDIKHHRIPNSALFFLGLAAFAFSVIEQNPGQCLLGGLSGLAAMLFLKALALKGIGTGDVKLSGVAGLVVGLDSVWAMFVLSWVIAAVAVYVIQHRRTITPQDYFPFGATMCIATMFVVLWQAIV